MWTSTGLRVWVFKGFRMFRDFSLGFSSARPRGSFWLGVLQCLGTLRAMRVWGLGLCRDYGVSGFRLIVVLQGLGLSRFWGSRCWGSLGFRVWVLYVEGLGSLIVSRLACQGWGGF